ncbi:MAG: redoxin domain-containing protein, partial [SAR324 cluster bacterium]|nr:redoxin domain-containing protein [SAR324 cluster bacterium]
FTAAHTRLVAVTTDSPQQNRAISRRLGLTMPILSDPHGEILKKLGMWDSRWKITAYGYYLLDPKLRVVSRQRGYWGVSNAAVAELLQELPAAAAGAP